MGPAAARDGVVSGAVLLEDGAVAFVLNLAELLDTSAHREAPPVLRPSEPAPEQKTASILVVDDSMTTRTLEKSILEAHGYRTILASDGAEALESFDQNRGEIQLLLTDLMMPKMDGAAAIKAIFQPFDARRNAPRDRIGAADAKACRSAIRESGRLGGNGRRGSD